MLASFTEINRTRTNIEQEKVIHIRFRLVMPSRPFLTSPIPDSELAVCEDTLRTALSPRQLRLAEALRDVMISLLNNPYDDDTGYLFRKHKLELALTTNELHAGYRRRPMLRQIQAMRVHRFLLDYAEFLTPDLARLRVDSPFRPCAWFARHRRWESWTEAFTEASQGGFVAGEHQSLGDVMRASATQLERSYDNLVSEISAAISRFDRGSSEAQEYIAAGDWKQLARKLDDDETLIDSKLAFSGISTALWPQFRDVLFGTLDRFRAQIHEAGVSLPLPFYRASLSAFLTDTSDEITD